MASAAGDSTRAIARSRVEISEYPQNLAAGGAITPLAFERFDLAAAGVSLTAPTGPFKSEPHERPSSVYSTPSAATVN